VNVSLHQQMAFEYRKLLCWQYTT